MTETAVGSLPQTQHRTMLLNMGPSHPAMHGIIKMEVELDGETIREVEIEIGYLHRGFEKSCETIPWNSVMPYTDRLNYVSPLINNVAYCMAVEKLLDLKTTPRCDYIRTIICEISRVTDHLTCVAASSMELGAFTVFLYMIKAREYLWDVVEELTGARLTTAYTRIGGIKADLPKEFEPKLHYAIAETRKVIEEVKQLLNRNRIFVDRMKNTGVCSKELAVSYGITGPFARGSGLDYDVRKDQPYLVYDELDWDVPIGENGDNLDRYFVRMEEMEQSMRMIEQCLEKMPAGPPGVDYETNVIPASAMVDLAKMGQVPHYAGAHVRACGTLAGQSQAQARATNAQEPKVVLPSKERTYGDIEGMINHFKLIMPGHGIRPAPGEAYQAVEGANGELGFYVVSDGSDQPYRVRCRPPCFTIMAMLPEILKGGMIADVIATFGSVNMIGGELDR